MPSWNDQCLKFVAMCSVHSAVSGEVLAVVEDYEGKTAREMKRILAAKLGISRFRQRIFSEENSELRDDTIFREEMAKVQLVLLEFCAPEVEEDKRMLAASMHPSAVLETLLLHPRDPNVRDPQGETPLHRVAFNGQTEAVRLLLEAGAAADARDARTQGWTPMLLAAYRGHAECVGLLIEAGANPDLTTLVGGSGPLHFAARSGHAEVVRLLIAAGVDLDKAKSDSGATPLHVAAERGHVKVVRLLIAAGADINKAKEDGATPLDIAVLRGQKVVACLLLEARAKQHETTASSYRKAASDILGRWSTSRSTSPAA